MREKKIPHFPVWVSQMVFPSWLCTTGFVVQVKLWSILSLLHVASVRRLTGWGFLITVCKKGAGLHRDGKSACEEVIKQTKTQYFMGHSFLLHCLLAWPVWISQIACKYSYTTESILPNWNICLLICGACLWSKVWMKMKNSSLNDAISISRIDATDLKSDR